MSQYIYVVVDESWNSYKYLYRSLSEAEEVAKRWSSELSRSEIMTYVLHIPATAQPRIHHADDVNQFAGEDWRVAKAYYKGRAVAKDRFKRAGIVTHEPRKAEEEARAAEIKATAAEARKEREREYQEQRQAAQKEGKAADAKRRAENEAWAAKSDSTLISEAKKYAKVTGDTTKSDSERFKAKTQVEIRLRTLTDRGRTDVQSIRSELVGISMGRKPDLPPVLTAPPELAADVLGGGMGLPPTPAAPKRKPAARTTRKQPAKPKAKKPAPKATPQVQSVFVKGDAKRVERGGVSWLTNVGNTVGRFRSWTDASTPGGGLHQHRIYPGVPFSQEELDTHYPELKRYTGLTKAKIGSAKVAFKDVQTPLAVQYKEYTYMVAADIARGRPGQQVPESMTKPTHTTEQQKYLDAHKREDVAGYFHDVIEYGMKLEDVIREAKRLEKQGSKVHIQLMPSRDRRPEYTLTTLENNGPQRTPAASPKPKKPPSVRSKSGMMSKDSVVLGDHSIVQVGATVMTKQGAGELRGIDRTTYSIPFCSVQLTDEGPHKYEHVYIAAAELTQKKIKKAATPTPEPAPTPSVPPALTAPPELAADVLGAGQAPVQAAPKPKKQPAARKPAPDLPPILVAPPELAADVLGGGMGLTPTAAPRRKPAARTTRKQPKKTAAVKTRKTAKKQPKAAKPKTKKTAATPKLTASQREYLAIQGFVMVKRGGKYIRITG